MSLKEPLTKEMRFAIENRQNILKKTMVKVTVTKDGKKSV